jgi:beta-lactamase class C
MRVFKILIGIAFLILFLVLLNSNEFKLKPIPEVKDSVSKIKLEKSPFDLIKEREYKDKQEKLKTALNTYFQKALLSGDIVGAGVSIVKNDSIVISNGFGKKSVGLNDDVDEETIFRLGSLSKGFAGVLAASLKSEGKLDWKDKVSDCIPGFRLGDSHNTQAVTLANILSHTSGVPYHSYTNLVEAGLSLKEIAERFSKVKPISVPGTMYSYQNAMFALCGEMINVKTGQDIKTSLSYRLFEPLGMCQTSMDYETLLHADNIAMPHSHHRNGWKTLGLSNNYYNAIAAGGISSTTSDMGRWMRFLLGHNPDVMNKSDIAEVFNPLVEIKGESKYYQQWTGHSASYYGLGWRIHKFVDKDTQDERTIWHHGGSVNNYRNEIALYPEADLGICVLLNSNAKLAKTVIPDLYEIVKDIYMQNRPTNIASSNRLDQVSSIR